MKTYNTSISLVVFLLSIASASLALWQHLHHNEIILLIFAIAGYLLAIVSIITLILPQLLVSFITSGFYAATGIALTIKLIQGNWIMGEALAILFLVNLICISLSLTTLVEDFKSGGVKDNNRSNDQGDLEYQEDPKENPMYVDHNVTKKGSEQTLVGEYPVDHWRTEKVFLANVNQSILPSVLKTGESNIMISKRIYEGSERLQNLKQKHNLQNSQSSDWAQTNPSGWVQSSLHSLPPHDAIIEEEIGLDDSSVIHRTHEMSDIQEVSEAGDITEMYVQDDNSDRSAMILDDLAEEVLVTGAIRDDPQGTSHEKSSHEISSHKEAVEMSTECSFSANATRSVSKCTIPANATRSVSKYTLSASATASASKHTSNASDASEDAYEDASPHISANTTDPLEDDTSPHISANTTDPLEDDTSVFNNSSQSIKVKKKKQYIIYEPYEKTLETLERIPEPRRQLSWMTKEDKSRINSITLQEWDQNAQLYHEIRDRSTNPTYLLPPVDRADNIDDISDMQSDFEIEDFNFQPPRSAISRSHSAPSLHTYRDRHISEHSVDDSIILMNSNKLGANQRQVLHVERSKTPEMQSPVKKFFQESPKRITSVFKRKSEEVSPIKPTFIIKPSSYSAKLTLHKYSNSYGSIHKHSSSVYSNQVSIPSSESSNSPIKSFKSFLSKTHKYSNSQSSQKNSESSHKYSSSMPSNSISWDSAKMIKLEGAHRVPDIADFWEAGTPESSSRVSSAPSDVIGEYDREKWRMMKYRNPANFSDLYKNTTEQLYKHAGELLYKNSGEQFKYSGAQFEFL